MIELSAAPRLAKKASLRFDRKTDQHVLLYPEKGLMLNATGTAILKRCDGVRTVAAIVDDLSLEYAQLDHAAMTKEVVAFLQSLVDRGLIEFEGA